VIRYLLDTNVISEPARPNPDPNVVAAIIYHAGEIAISSTVWHELTYGVLRLPSGRKREFLLDYIRMSVWAKLRVLSYDAEAATWHANERGKLIEAGQRPSFADGMIASVSATRGLILVTRNVRDFEPFEDLRIENWFI
jgi:tRNA(fMet)-specific endonuclease VapC